MTPDKCSRCGSQHDLFWYLVAWWCRPCVLAHLKEAR
jgi:hypothetical protein